MYFESDPNYKQFFQLCVKGELQQKICKKIAIKFYSSLKGLIKSVLS